MPHSTGQIHLLGQTGQPSLLIQQGDQTRSIPFTRLSGGDNVGRPHWLAEPVLPAGGAWRFQIAVDGSADRLPAPDQYFTTQLRTLWVQEGQLFSYKPAATVSPSRVVKIKNFRGRLSTRPLYIYLPRGYDEHPWRAYPVLYMHDGQNCFESYVEDSFAGSWRADRVADELIGGGRMRECLIVGVSNGGHNRLAEYLPPYAIHRPWSGRPGKGSKKQKQSRPLAIRGRADRTAAYYKNDVALYIQQQYRALSERDQRATCGSSLGGLFSAYLAWEQPSFARHHAVLSPSFWMTRRASGKMETIERLRRGKPREVRLWLDSGTLDAPNRGNDGMYDTLAARKALLENGYREGADFCYHLARGAMHHEAAWAARLPMIFEFLFPLK